MAKFAVTIDKATREIRGLWRGKGPAIPAPDPSLDYEMEEVTEQEHVEISTKGITFGGGSEDHRWKHISGVIQEQNDPRPLVRFTPTQVELDIGDPPGQVQIDLLDFPNFSGGRVMNLPDGRKIRITFASGTALVNVPTGRAFHMWLGDTAQFTVEAPLEVTVYGTELEG